MEFKTMCERFTTTQIIAKEGWRNIAIVFVIFLLSCWVDFGSHVMFIVLLLFITIYRNPERIAAEDDPLAILAPIDGKIIAIERIESNLLGDTKCLHVKIRSLPFDVSMIRSPASTNLTNVKAIHGLFLPPHKKEAEKLNERLEINCSYKNLSFVIRIVAGVFAKKINLAKNKGSLKAGERIAFVTDGIVELFLPFDSRIKLSIGDYVKGAESVIGYFAYKD
ncbi:MAG: phosphatidylserine decarboxylase [Campylobacteraceae bacterium]|jgi:phosphatidylserine decarboxylase|nr:phosphatidylserine decarboxylase [Campylobacteraceae bacterium]